MKRFHISSMLIALTILAQAQNPTVRTGTGSRGERNIQQVANTAELSVRAQMMNEQLTQEIGNARWVRNILREVDLTKEKNAPLYYPVREMNGTKNLFTTLFQLLSEDKITVYNYLEDRESFDDENIMSFKVLLEKLNIYYDEIPAGGGFPFRYVINASDIPSREVSKLYVKESWYFDQNNSMYDVKTLAICPIVTIIMQTGEERLEAMFWVKYEDIRPYINSNYIMTSSINNAKTYTMDDFFRLRMYDGEIIQTENLMNLPLVRLFETDEEVYAEQQRIESQLKEFRDSLWVKPDTTAVVLSRREARRVSSARSSSSATAKAPKEKAPKQPKAAPTEKATRSTTTRSIRR